MILEIILLSSLTLIANADSPNGIDQQPEPGWSLWLPKEEAKNADFDAGFSNLELGGYLEFENACKTSTGLAESQIKYWFRLSDRVNRIGTGRLEQGCWDGERFLHTHSSTAIKVSLNNVDCLRVKSPAGGIIIRSEPANTSQLLRIIANGKTVKPSYFPASIVNTDNRSWVSIISPVEGWISDGSFAGKGNLRLCSN